MTDQERHAKMSEGVAQIGKLVGHCAKHGLTESDIMIMLQTSTSLVCEMNKIEIAEYMKFLYVLHKRRTGHPEEDLAEPVIDAELAVIFSAPVAQEGTQP